MGTIFLSVATFFLSQPYSWTYSSYLNLNILELVKKNQQKKKNQHVYNKSNLKADTLW